MGRLTGNQAYDLMEAYSSIYESQELTEEQTIEYFNLWVDGLLSEGYDLSEYTYNQLYDYYLNENWGPIITNAIRAGLRSGFNLPLSGSVRKALASKGIEGITRSGAQVVKSLKNIALGSSAKNTGGKRKLAALVIGADILANQGRITKSIGSGIQSAWRAASGDGDRSSGTAKPTPGQSSPERRYIPPSSLTQSADILDIVKGYLINEGYADTEDNAFKIMAHMSEDWRIQILNSYSFNEA